MTATDGKSHNTTYTYDPRGRQKSQQDRLSGTLHSLTWPRDNWID
ncbi:MAG: hypothetical protein KDB03_24555 [Planctomycetales bacterium]|nr:hypothetical protein [Planctomycetales bacterium]